MRPALYPQYAALRGDTTDNLPGVPGVGEKTAAKLINQYGGLDGIFANVDKQTPKLRDNLAEHEERARKNLDLMVLRRDAPLDAVDFDSLAVVPKPDEVKRLFDFLEFRTFADRLAEALGDGRGIARSGAERRAGRRGHRRRVGGRGGRADRLAGGARRDAGVERRAGPQHAARPRLRHRRPRRPTSPGCRAGCSPTTSVAASSPATPTSAVTTSRRSCARCSSADIDLTGLRLDTAIAAYLIDPAEARYDARRPDHEVHAVRPARQRRRRRASSTSTAPRRAMPSGPAARRSPCTTSPSRSRPASPRREWPSSTTTIENPLVRVLARMEHVGVGVDAEMLRDINARLTAEVTSSAPSCGGSPAATTSTSTRRPSCGRCCSTSVGPMGVKKTKSGYSTDAADAREAARPVARVHRAAAAPSRGREAARHLRRGPAPGDRRRRSHPRHVQPDRRPHRPAQLRQAEPAQHPGPQRRRPRVPHRVRAVPRPQLLVADYNQIELRCIAHLAARSRADRGVHERAGHPQRHRGARVRGRAEGGHPRPALEGEDGLVRARLRDGGVRPRSAAEHPDRGGRQDPRRLLRGVPERQGVHGRHRRSRRGRTVTPRRCSAAGGRSPSCSTRTGGSARPASGRR